MSSIPDIESLVAQEHAAIIAEHKRDGSGVLEIPIFRPLTEMGNAERFVSQHGANVRYCHDWRAWLAWDGTRWRRDAGAEVRQLAKDTVRTIYAEAGKYATEAQRAAAANWAKRSESFTRRFGRSSSGSLRYRTKFSPCGIQSRDERLWLVLCFINKSHNDYTTKTL